MSAESHHDSLAAADGATGRGRTARSGPRPDWRDALCVGLLALACLLLRGPALGAVALNPDESQYEATASFLVASGGSAFDLPLTTAGAQVVYVLIARAFGPYATFEVRVLVLLLGLSVATMLFLIVRSATAWWSGLIAGLTFVHYHVSVEGFTANREWFALPLQVLAAWLGLIALGRDDRRASWTMLASGVCAGLALWFKAQVVLLVAVVPVWLLWRAYATGSYRTALRHVLLYGAGATLAVVGYLLQFWLAGTLGALFELVLTGWNSYVVGNQAAATVQDVGRPGLYLERFFTDLPQRSIPLAAYLLALLGLGAVARRALRRQATSARSTLEHPALQLFILYLLAAMASVQLGLRFFDHYYLLMFPPLAALFGFAVYLALTEGGASPATRRLTALLLALLLLERIVWLQATRPDHWLDDWRRLAFQLVPVIAVLLLWIARPLRAVHAALAALLTLQLAALVVSVQLTPRPRSLPHHRPGFENLAKRIDALREPGDRLFVWGWLPEIYSLTRLEAASMLTVGTHVVRDYVSFSKPPELNAPMVERLMSDLRAREPRFIVDATRRSWTMHHTGDPRIYRLESYPDFELNRQLREHYRRVGTFDGCDLYVRR